MGSGDAGGKNGSQQQAAPYYGTFEYRPSVGFPQPLPHPGVYGAPSAPPPHPTAGTYYPQGYHQTITVVEGTPVNVIMRERRLPCCGIGLGWFLFIIGFFLASIPWYVGAFLLLCSRVDHREKPGYIACIVAAVIATVAVVFGISKGADDW